MSAPSSAQAPLRTVRTGDLLEIWLERPDRGNALSATLVAQLHEAVEQASADPRLRLLVLRGAGRHFCTGFDLSALEQETDHSLLARFTRVELMLQAVHAAPFPTLALAQGRTMGAGADLFAACSERWIVGEASFAFPGAAFGLVLGTARLADQVGAGTAAGWVESGAVIDGPAALAAGLATRQVEMTDLESALAARREQAQRLDLPTHRAIHAAVADDRRRRGTDGDARDLARLVRSAARPGLQQRIAAYRDAQRKA
ncbi:enoyl-CoA hydratase/isomerase family protein [Pseudacidovorax sp. RU35E]|uniref:enoyl-CoA hydratase/isomerase family protein n=1 Tax=Pseudacidovorax sp. RU35E TaxID=1907403 RepID=UPI0009550595|nr:enoyl-CoA hydratase/isomerase family protein [Pseudacidovorax sp. RU35E]SIQ54060.1 Enoyl-CoA hydratase/carnithine racemase [Pseudacidovorax sp. RU35E]